MKITLPATLSLSLAGVFAQQVFVEEWLSGDCNGRPFITANVYGGADGTSCVNVEQFPATNIKVSLVKPCNDGKIPTIKVSSVECALFETEIVLSADGSCNSVDFTPWAYEISCS
ncbi:integral membrane protein [Fusarium mundagurra]|uniref:Integral membrane protein n=1 Tax=Fusarium mundagurra TaxID=1567541 RepID=A0A8H6D1E1_9HYPO|nr:integral membrane protein [Fusarium mundagurra]